MFPGNHFFEEHEVARSRIARSARVPGPRDIAAWKQFETEAVDRTSGMPRTPQPARDRGGEKRIDVVSLRIETAHETATGGDELLGYK